MIADLNRVMEQIEKDKGIPQKSLVEAIEAAMLSAAHKKLGYDTDIEAHFNEELGEVELFEFKTVVDEIDDEYTEVTMDEAKKLDPDATVGDSIGQKLDAKLLGRIAAQTAKQVIIQKIREAERDIVFQQYKDKVGSVLSGIVRRLEKGNLVVDLGKTEAIIAYREQIPGESYKTGDRIQAYFMELNTSGRGAQVLLSRRHPGLLKALFEMEVPEIAEGIVEIKSCAREPGVRAKVAVYSADSDVDPVGACVGMKGSRVQSVVQELRGEKIDIVLWDPDHARFVCNAIAPAEVSKVIIKEKDSSMEIIVPDDQLSLAIGRKGQNVRLAANLTGWNIDIYSESKIEELATQAKSQLVEDLGVDEATATILYSHVFRSAEEIVEVGLDEFLNIPGMSKENLKEIFDKATAVANSRTKAKPKAKSDVILKKKEAEKTETLETAETSQSLNADEDSEATQKVEEDSEVTQKIDIVPNEKH